MAVGGGGNLCTNLKGDICISESFKISFNISLIFIPVTEIADLKGTVISENSNEGVKRQVR